MWVPATDGSGHACYQPGIHDFTKFSDAGSWDLANEPLSGCYASALNSRAVMTDVSRRDITDCIFWEQSCATPDCSGYCASDSVYN